MEIPDTLSKVMFWHKKYIFLVYSLTKTLFVLYPEKKKYPRRMAHRFLLKRNYLGTISWFEIFFWN